MKQQYTYSQLSSASVAELVATQYGLLNIEDCRFYVLGLHDNYLIRHASEKYILRIYRNDWRSTEDILFELEILDFLGKQRAPVASPIRTDQGELCFFIESPEGNRAAALFCYADGHAPASEITPKQATLLGKTVARVHQIADTFQSRCTRKPLDLPYLLDESINAIDPFIDPEARNYIRSLQQKLKDAMPSIPDQHGIYGICMGDVNPGNFHINDNNDITLFDFDQCGYGYRAFEIGKFNSSIHTHQHKQELATSFVDGYRQVRQLSDNELCAIPYFEIISVIWVMAIHVYNADRIGYKMLEKPFWQRRLAIIEQLDKHL